MKNSNSNSLSSQFNGIQFLIPIRGKYAIGLTIKPINSHNTYMQTDTLNVQYYDDSINSFKEFRSGGGIMASNFAFTLPINAKMNIGFGYDNYFGSSRNEKSIILNDIYYRSLNIISYKGSKYNTYFSGEIFESDKLLSFKLSCALCATFFKKEMTNTLNCLEGKILASNNCSTRS